MAQQSEETEDAEIMVEGWMDGAIIPPQGWRKEQQSDENEDAEIMVEGWIGGLIVPQGWKKKLQSDETKDVGIMVEGWIGGAIIPQGWTIGFAALEKTTEKRIIFSMTNSLLHSCFFL